MGVWTSRTVSIVCTGEGCWSGCSYHLRQACSCLQTATSASRHQLYKILLLKTGIHSKAQPIEPSHRHPCAHLFCFCRSLLCCTQLLAQQVDLCCCLLLCSICCTSHQVQFLLCGSQIALQLLTRQCKVLQQPLFMTLRTSACQKGRLVGCSQIWCFRMHQQVKHNMFFAALQLAMKQPCQCC